MKCSVVALIPLLLATSVTQAGASTGETEIAKAEKAMRERLKGLSGVKFTHAVYVPHSRAVCARFTAKDGDVYYFGTVAVDADGKVFERRYLYIDDSHSELKSGDVETNADAIYLLCRKSSFFPLAF